MTAKPRDGARARRLGAISTFVVLVALLLIWMIGTPPFGGADEQAHDARAASVARGHLRGESVAGQPKAVTRVDAPDYVAAGQRNVCWRRMYGVTPRCQGTITGTGVLVPVQTYESSFPPEYAAFVGVFSYIGSPRALYLMRLAGALMSAALLTAGIGAVLRTRRPYAALGGALLAITPQVAQTAAVVNPSALEICASIALWPNLFLALDAEGPTARRAGIVAAIAGAVLAVSRQGSLLWLGLAVVLSLAAYGSGARIRRLLRALPWWAYAVAAAGVAAALVWIAYAGTAVLPLNLVPRSVHGWPLLHLIWRRSALVWERMVGGLQWVDPSPRALIISWLVATALFLAIALAVGSWRERAALFALSAASLGIPIALEYAGAHTVGLVWVGRWSLPLSTGVPLLAGYAIARATPPGAARWRRALATGAASVAAACAATGHLIAFYWEARRNAVGLNGPLWFFARPAWRPPVAAWILLAGTGLIVLAVAPSVLTRRVRVATAPGAR